MTAEGLRFARKVGRFCRFGSRPIFGLLREIGAERLLRQPLKAKLDITEHGSITSVWPSPGGGRMPAPPLHLVQHSR